MSKFWSDTFDPCENYFTWCHFQVNTLDVGSILWPKICTEFIWNGIWIIPTKVINYRVMSSSWLQLDLWWIVVIYATLDNQICLHRSTWNNLIIKKYWSRICSLWKIVKTQWMHESTKSENLGQCGKPNMLWPYVSKNLEVGEDFRPCSKDNFLTGCL